MGHGKIVVLSVLMFGCSPTRGLPTVHASGDLGALDGRRVDVVGKYVVDDMGRYRVTTAPAEGEPVTSSEVVYVELVDGAAIRIGARPSAERLALEGKTVTARGRLDVQPRQPPDDVAQVAPSPWLADVEKIEHED
jgi:hypothetical protein